MHTLFITLEFKLQYMWPNIGIEKCCISHMDFDEDDSIISECWHGLLKFQNQCKVACYMFSRLIPSNLCPPPPSKRKEKHTTQSSDHGSLYYQPQTTIACSDELTEP